MLLLLVLSAAKTTELQIKYFLFWSSFLCVWALHVCSVGMWLEQLCRFRFMLNFFLAWKWCFLMFSEVLLGFIYYRWMLCEKKIKGFLLKNLQGSSILCFEAVQGKCHIFCILVLLKKISSFSIFNWCYTYKNLITVVSINIVNKVCAVSRCVLCFKSIKY